MALAIPERLALAIPPRLVPIPEALAIPPRLVVQGGTAAGRQIVVTVAVVATVATAAGARAAVATAALDAGVKILLRLR